MATTETTARYVGTSQLRKEDAELITRYRDAGVARLVFTLPPAKADEILPVLDRCVRLMRQAGG